MLDAATAADTAYDLFSRRDPAVAPGLILGVTSTGIFCRAGCPARMPKPENCRFFASTHAAQAAGFRACLRCHPLGRPENQDIEQLIADIATSEDPIREADLPARGLSPSTMRRHSRERFGRTFSQYQREQRLLRARDTLAEGERVVFAQVDAGYGSASGFRDAYAKAFGTAPSGTGGAPLRMAWIETPLERMVVLADTTHLHLCEFTDRKALSAQVDRIRRLADRPVVVGRTAVTDQFEMEMAGYFDGTLRDFTVPVTTNGTDFQRQVWEGLRALPYGTTATYSDLARDIGKPRAVRAAASSNAANALAIVIPCHRIVPKSGGVGGYAGGAARKAWLLAHEAQHKD